MLADIHISHRPAAPLDRFVEQLWYWEGVPPSRGRDRLLPTGCAGLIINLAEDELRDYTGPDDACVVRYPGAVLVGAYSRYSVIDAAEQRAVLGVSFRPGGMAPFFRFAADEFHNSHASLADVWGCTGASLRERVLAAATPHERLRVVEMELLARAMGPLQRRVEVDFVLAQLSQYPDLSIAELSQRAGLSARRISRLFAIETGLTPKLYARMSRFGHALRLMNADGMCWSELALRCGYFDQSHLINDCKAISGCTPAQLRTLRIGNTHHVAC